jgi:D-alanyl-lipoteichoic acid acyltransferase DltB (MBOAT superfamily)
MYFLDYRFLALVPVLVAVYWLAGWLAGPRVRNAVLLAGSVAWLVVFSPSTLIALGALTLAIVYPVAAIADGIRARGNPRRAVVVAAAGTVVLIAVATLLRLKAYFFPALALSRSPVANEVLHWIGFSYFLLKAIHVMFATARGIVARPSLVTLGHYVVFLPTLTAGPIYRLDGFAEQLAAAKRLSWDDVQDGLLRVLIGMAKKVVAVPLLAGWSSDLHAGGLARQPAAFVVTYVMLFLDFSGYTDIAIGIGRLLGFTVPENFKNPFTATTLTQFWRNWHATLGDWLRENVFIPLGGVRATGWQLSAIVLGSMFVVGIWHGYRWIFIAWGIYHGVMLLLENRLGVKPLRTHRTPRWQLVLRYAIVQAIVIGGMFAFIGGLEP